MEGDAQSCRGRWWLQTDEVTQRSLPCDFKQEPWNCSENEWVGQTAAKACITSWTRLFRDRAVSSRQQKIHASNQPTPDSALGKRKEFCLSQCWCGWKRQHVGAPACHVSVPSHLLSEALSVAMAMCRHRSNKLLSSLVALHSEIHDQPCVSFLVWYLSSFQSSCFLQTEGQVCANAIMWQSQAWLILWSWRRPRCWRAMKQDRQLHLPQSFWATGIVQMVCHREDNTGEQFATL